MRTGFIAWEMESSDDDVDFGGDSGPGEVGEKMV